MHPSTHAHIHTYRDRVTYCCVYAHKHTCVHTQRVTERDRESPNVVCMHTSTHACMHTYTE